MRIDLHCHSKFSGDSLFEPEELIEEALRKGLDGACFTEHHSFMASRPVERIQVPEGFSVFRGLEISTDQGHLLVYGLKDDAWNVWGSNEYLDFVEVVEKVHALGGICVPAHPFRTGDSFVKDLMSVDGFDAIETHNGMNSDKENEKAIQVSKLRSLPSIGGSDCHKRVQVGRAYTVFENPVRSIEDLIREILSGNCRGEIRR